VDEPAGFDQRQDGSPLAAAAAVDATLSPPYDALSREVLAD